MRFAVITQIEHFEEQEKLYSYAPYVREMNLWFEHVDEVIVVAPLSIKNPGKIDISYRRAEIDFREVPSVSLTSFSQLLKALLKLPGILLVIYNVMKHADHIHLRCPGNMGLLGSIVQIVFPNKKKTVKYAGNWDPKAKQPWSYRLQKWILRNPFLTRNINVLVYGEWTNQTKNIKPFFTASYTEREKTALPYRKYDLPLRFLFVGSLVVGKQPDYVIHLIESLIENGFPCELHFYGDGNMREELESYLSSQNLKGFVYLHGNQNPEDIKEAYQKSHFLILPSKSEGWPKVVAEAMWWGVIPVVTPVSCVPWMLGNQTRGVLMSTDLEKDTQKLTAFLQDKVRLREMSLAASEWSRMYTLDLFNAEIKKLL